MSRHAGPRIVVARPRHAAHGRVVGKALCRSRQLYCGSAGSRSSLSSRERSASGPGVLLIRLRFSSRPAFAAGIVTQLWRRSVGMVVAVVVPYAGIMIYLWPRLPE
jgi:hypothetical protein